MKLLSCALVSCAVCLSTAAYAQTPGAAEQSLDAALGQSLTSSPVPGQTFVSINAGGTWMTGWTETKGWSIDGIASHVTKSGWLFRGEAEASRNDLRLPPSGPTVQVEDSQMVSGLAMHRLRKGLSFVTIGGWRRDRLLELDYRVWAEAGVGVHLVEGQKFNLLVVPMFAIGVEQRTFTETGDSVADIAVMQSMSYRPHDKFTLDEFVSWHMDTTSTRDRYFAFNVSATSKIAGMISLKVYYQHQNASLVPAGTDTFQTTLGTALQFTFQRTPPAPAAAPVKP